MPARNFRHIALTGPLVSYVEEEIARGQYASASEMVRASLRLPQERDEERKSGIRPFGHEDARGKAG